jgi:hypothetical protein
VAYPGKAILITKYDYSNAYQGIAHSASVAAQTISTLGAFAYVYLHLMFDGSPNPPKPGKTKLIHLGGLVFLDSLKQKIAHDRLGLVMAEYLTLMFEDQKNAKKNDKRTQWRTPHINLLCPVKRAGSLAHRIHLLVPGYDETTTINTVHQMDG